MGRLTRFYKTLLAAFVGAYAVSAHALFDEPIAPQYSQTDYAIYVYGMSSADKLSKFHLFGSDGQYCYQHTTDGRVKSVGGQWVRQGNQINITYHAPKRTFFGLWHSWGDYEADTALVDVKKLTSHEGVTQGFDGQPFLLGFGHDTPTHLAVFDPNHHDAKQPVPKGASHVFVGEFVQGKNSHALTAFSLKNFDHIKALQGDDHYALSLATTPNTLSDDEIAERPTTFDIKHNILMLDDKPDIFFISNDTNTDVIRTSNYLHECQGGNPLRSLQRFYEDFNETPQEKAIVPFLVPDSHTITYQGTIDDGAWLKRQ